MGTLLVFLVIVLLILVAYYLSRYLFKRAVRQVIWRFRAKGAINPKSAATLEELGLAPRKFLENMFKTRDYKPYALQLLIEADVVRPTPDGRFFLSESELGKSNVRRLAGIE